MLDVGVDRPPGSIFPLLRGTLRGALVVVGLLVVGTRLARTVRAAPRAAGAAGGRQAKYPAIRRFNRDHFNPLLLKVVAALGIDFTTIVHHRGRRSGTWYATPVFGWRFDGGFLLPLTYGPETDWAKNVRAAGGGELERRGRRYRVNAPRVVALDQAKAVVPGVFAALWSLVGIREVLVLEHVGGASHAGSSA